MGCQGQNAKGKPCGAPVYKDDWCYVHHPGIGDERAATRRKGGANRSNVVRAERQMVAFSIGNVRTILSTVLQDLLNGETDIGVASTAATLGRAIIVANKEGELERRIETLEVKAGIVKDEDTRP